MKFRHLILLMLFGVLVSVNVKGAEYSLQKAIKEKEDEELRLKEQIARVEEQIYVDSLLNSISVDALTQTIYTRMSSENFRPKVFGGYSMTFDRPLLQMRPLEDVKFGTIHYLDTIAVMEYEAELPPILNDPIPEWFKKSRRAKTMARLLRHRYMILNPSGIEYAAWDLPEPPELPEEDYTFRGFLRRLKLPEIDPDVAVIPDIEIKKVNWLHTFNVGLQLSQAYISSNWYQGGNDYISVLFNLLWNVELNPVYHPNLLFQSSFQYKLGVNSTPKGSLHKYNTSQDLLQYNLKTGLKAFNNHWFYTLTLLFETQLFDAYPDDATLRNSAFLSPGTLNVGIGMTYSLVNPKKTFNLTASISPLAYNLKTCIAKDIDHELFNIPQNKKSISEIGSSAEINMTWNITSNISYKTRLFLFTDYSYFLGDWENTFNFQLTKVLSTQLFLHPRFDSSSEYNSKWKHFMMKEILSFGISYTFTNKV